MVVDVGCDTLMLGCRIAKVKSNLPYLRIPAARQHGSQYHRPIACVTAYARDVTMWFTK